MSEAIQKCIKAMRRLGTKHPHFLLTHSKLKGNYVEVKSESKSNMTTMAMSSSGRIYVNDKFAKEHNMDELGGVVAHEILHLIYLHHLRVHKRDSWKWNIATDMCINKALRDDGILLPKSALYPPNEYDGDLHAEPLYEWLEQNPKYVPQKPVSIVAGAGCSITEDGDITGEVEIDGQKVSAKELGKLFSKTDLKKMGAEMRAAAQMAGRGSSAVAALLAPREAKIPWKNVLRTGFALVNTKPGRDFQTFSKRNRRSPQDGIQMPGWKGYSPSIGVCIDVSGSMDREWINEIVSECLSLMRDFQGTRVYVTSHTDQLTWAGWLKDGTDTKKLEEAVSFSGGTDPTPAYDNMAKALRGQKFDAIIHFTDTQFFSEWPEVPAKKLVVGCYGTAVATQPPKGSMVFMMCREDPYAEHT